MRVFLPYTRIQPVTRYAMRHYEYTAVRLDGTDGYSRFLEERWNEAEDFVNVEHDVIPWRGAIEEIKACPQPWCTFLTDVDNKMFRIPTLNVAKFGAQLLRDHPIDWAAQRVDKFPSWQHCDSWIKIGLETRGVEVHYHSPAVINANPLLVEFYARAFSEVPGDRPETRLHFRETLI